jgi:hypothetical protein
VPVTAMAAATVVTTASAVSSCPTVSGGTSAGSDQIAACLEDLEHEYVTAVDDNGELKFLPVVSERARAKLNQMAARKTRPPKQKTQPLAQLRKEWKDSAIRTSKVAVDVINSLLEHARAAAAAIRARVAAVVDVALAAVDVTATVFVMNEGGRFHRRHLLAEARRHLALVLRGRRRDPGLDDQIVAAAISTHCLDISEPKTVRGLEADYRLYTARWDLSDLPARRRPPTPAPGPDRQPPADTGEPAAPRPPDQTAGEWEIPRVPLQYDRAVLAGAVVREKLRTTTVRGRAYDVVAHQQAAMPEQLLAPAAADPEHDDQEPEAGHREAIDLTALRALRESRTDVEALDINAERLRHLRDAFTKAADDSRAARTATPNRTTPTQCTRCVRTTNARTTSSSRTHAKGQRLAPAAEPTHWAHTGELSAPSPGRMNELPQRQASVVTRSF